MTTIGMVLILCAFVALAAWMLMSDKPVEPLPPVDQDDDEDGPPYPRIPKDG